MAAETTRMPMLFTDALVPGRPITFANDAFLKLTGYRRAEVIGQPFVFLMALGAGQQGRAEVDAAFRDERGGHFEMRERRKDGSLFSAAVFMHPVPNAAGKVLDHFVSFVDLTDHQRETERLRFLLDELNHRTQNTLATVQAIAAQTLRGVTEQEVVKAFQGRIFALGRAHALLGRHDWEAVTLRDVLDRILQPFDDRVEGVSKFVLEGPSIHLAPKLALTLAMVFHELASNAVTYGALSSMDGHVAVSWRTDAEQAGDRIVLTWREIGGPPVAKPVHKGFGARLIEGGLAQELNGEVHVDYDAAGLVCHIAMPLLARVAA
jgi:PAS domain S-box-containing protein